MVNRKRWSVQEETELKALVGEKLEVEEIAARLQKTPGAVIVKCQRLGLQFQAKDYLCSSLPMSRQLPSVEETAKMLASALKASLKPGLNRLEVQRLQTVANIARAYKEHIIELAHYSEVEIKMKEIIEQNVKLQQTLKRIEERSQNLSSERVSSPVG